MTNFAITVSQIHIPPEHFQKAVGEELIFLWLFEQNDSDIKVNFVLNSSVYITYEIFLYSFIILGSEHFISDNGFWYCFVF